MLCDFKQGTHPLWAPASHSTPLSASTFVALPQSSHLFLALSQVNHLPLCPTWSPSGDLGPLEPWRQVRPPPITPRQPYNLHPQVWWLLWGAALCLSVCVCVRGKGGIWKIPKLGSFVASDFSCLLHPSSLNAPLPEIWSQTLFLWWQSPLALLWQPGTLRVSTCPSPNPWPLTLGTRLMIENSGFEDCKVLALSFPSLSHCCCGFWVWEISPNSTPQPRLVPAPESPAPPYFCFSPLSLVLKCGHCFPSLMYRPELKEWCMMGNSHRAAWEAPTLHFSRENIQQE